MTVGVFFFCKQNTAYEMRMSDWSSDVCSSDLVCAEFSMIAAQHQIGCIGFADDGNGKRAGKPLVEGELPPMRKTGITGNIVDHHHLAAAYRPPDRPDTGVRNAP